MPEKADNEVENGAVFSFSMISTFENCPKMYEFKYLKKRKEAFKTIEAFFGELIHDALEWLYSEQASLNKVSLVRQHIERIDVEIDKKEQLVKLFKKKNEIQENLDEAKNKLKWVEDSKRAALLNIKTFEKDLRVVEEKLALAPQSGVIRRFFYRINAKKLRRQSQALAESIEHEKSKVNEFESELTLLKKATEEIQLQLEKFMEKMEKHTLDPVEEVQATIKKLEVKREKYRNEIRSAKRLIAWFEEKWEKNWHEAVQIVRRGESAGDYLNLGKEILENHFEEYVEDALKTVQLEAPIRVRLNGKHNYTGRVDRVAVDEDGEYHVIEYKTTKKMPESRDAVTALQTQGYGLAILLQHNLQRVYVHTKYLRYSKELCEEINLDLRNSIENQLASRIESLLFAESFPSKPSGLCNWCGFRKFCSDSGYSGVCPECGSNLELREGKYGPFMGCKDYPECRYTRDALPEEIEDET